MSKIHSMTAFSRLESNCTWGQLTWEIRSVNHRYLEPSFKLHDMGRSCEPMLREHLRQQLSRGKVDCMLRITLGANEGAQLAINETQVNALLEAQRKIAAISDQSTPLSTASILGWPGVLEDQAADREAVNADVITTFKAAVNELRQSREREGAELQQMIDIRLDKLEQEVALVKQELPKLLQAQRQKLEDRLADIKAELDPNRLEQELVMAAQKADVDEEMDRLATHITEVRRVLHKGGACGRRLDFLMQELNREANTLSSKSVASITTQAAVEMKVLIEQMREQIQNIE
ncbi:MAG: YicC/YloC family endoribonuclease [Pseudomonadales bacterium]